ncbi:MAG: ketopantoate reductase family protein [Candidatus Omnitrophica bacterium]|nr:ketopantoate reductase family protein [Candidatus Omnitrophota bacterium]MBU2473117.1 ketopantoate reductase family protein [Candidatus Omnitrophota bacterium]
MKVAVLGCGAIGGLFLGYLTKQGHDVTGVVRDYQKELLLKEGLDIEGVRGSQKIKVKVDTKLTEKVDLAIFATKINDLELIIKDNLEFLKDSTAISTQNGIRADYILKNFFAPEKIISSIVMFGATFYPPDKVIHNFEGELVLGNVYETKVGQCDQVVNLLSPVFKVVNSENIKGAKYLKLFVNLNNCIPAILGVSMQEAFADIDLARLAIKLNKEAYQLVNKADIKLASLLSYPKERIEGLVKMPLDEAAGLFSKIMTNLSKQPLYGSILQSIRRGKKSEIDYINGEIIQLARDNNDQAPLNTKIVELVHKVEAGADFLSKQELLKGVAAA